MLQIISGKFYQNKEIHNNPTQCFYIQMQILKMSLK